MGLAEGTKRRGGNKVLRQKRSSELNDEKGIIRVREHGEPTARG